MNLDFKTYSATGNIIGVAYYPDVFDMQKIIDSLHLREDLKRIATASGCDSVMVVIPTGQFNPVLKTAVFEPNNIDPHGTFSVMCGNGVRAVAEYVSEYLNYSNWPLLLGTQSGILEIEKISDHSYRVLMGKALTNKHCLRSYLNQEYFLESSDELVDVAIPNLLLKKLVGLPFGRDGAICSIGFSTTEKDVAGADGEPHLMIQLERNSIGTIDDLKEIAQKYGAFICNDIDVFPLGMNVNFVVPDGETQGTFLVCTFERNLGEDPKKSVTQACGTGCTFVSAEQMRKYHMQKSSVRCLGGKLTVEKRDGSLYLSGNARQIPAFCEELVTNSPA